MHHASGTCVTRGMKQTCLFRRSWKQELGQHQAKRRQGRQGLGAAGQGNTAEPGMPTGTTRTNEREDLLCFGTVCVVGPSNGAQRYTGR